PQYLPAGAARWRELHGIRRDRDTPELAGAFRQRFEHRNTFGAERQPESRVLDVAPGEYLPVLILQSRAHFESGKRRVGIFARGDGLGDERVIHVRTNAES